jgi:hypothetical protein
MVFPFFVLDDNTKLMNIKNLVTPKYILYLCITFKSYILCVYVF